MRFISAVAHGQTQGSLTYWIYSLSTNDWNAWNVAQARYDLAPTPIHLTRDTVRGNEDIGLYSVFRNDVAWDGQSAIYHNVWDILSVSSEINDFYTDAYNSSKRNSVTTHEMGHAMGLAHETGAVVMNASTCGSNSRWCTFAVEFITSDDLHGLQAMYP